MNGLSWFLYLAGVAGSVVSVLSFLCFVLAVVILIINWVSNYEGYLHEDNYRFKIVGVPYVIVFVAMLLMSAIIPSKDTLYMIAGSEIGEVVITSPENQIVFDKVRELVNTRLDAAIGEKNVSK